MQDFNFEDFQMEHERLLETINGQWLDETMNTSLWLSQGCYWSGKCEVTGKIWKFYPSCVHISLSDMARCENIILDNLPYGFKHLKPKDQILIVRDNEMTEEYKTPIGASVRQNYNCGIVYFVSSRLILCARKTTRRSQLMSGTLTLMT